MALSIDYSEVGAGAGFLTRTFVAMTDNEINSVVVVPQTLSVWRAHCVKLQASSFELERFNHHASYITRHRSRVSLTGSVVEILKGRRREVWLERER